MTIKRFSLYYLAAYLIPTGLGLIFVPALVFKLLFSSQDYGDVIPRLAGALVLALGILVVNIIWRDIDGLLPGLIGARIAILAVLGALFIKTRDPFFVAVGAVVAVGVVLTVVGAIRGSEGT